MTDFRHTVTKEDDGLEVREIMRKYFDFSSRLRNKIKREKLVYRNGEKTEGWHRTQQGDVILVVLPEERSNFPPQDIPLDIIFQDDDLLIVNKQPGLIVHPTKGHPDGTVANALAWHMDRSGDHWKIRFVNRLDMDTSGLLVVAKNAYCQNEYTNQSKKDLVKKRYYTIVRGIITEDRGTVDLPIGRPDPEDVRRGVVEDGAPSVTHYSVIERFNKSGCTLVELLLETGRTHQIRVHMSSIGHPVLGDHLYGKKEPDIIGRQALHAFSLEFIHPVKKEPLHFEAPLPVDMIKAIDILRG